MTILVRAVGLTGVFHTFVDGLSPQISDGIGKEEILVLPVF